MTGMIKICGVTTAEAVRAAEDAGATHVGFNFVETSPRFMETEAAAALARRTILKTVAVTADRSDNAIARLLSVFRPGALQLHGAEDPQRVAHVAARFGLPVIKALGISSAEDLRAARAFAPCADMLLFDAKPPKADATTPTGGHGRVFDWKLLAGLTFAKPWFLSGGLTPTNVADAIRIARPPGVDVASGVESARGVKDAQLIGQFCQAAAKALAVEPVA
jgi:phosphoribosylanthranilate isomerase